MRRWPSILALAILGVVAVTVLLVVILNACAGAAVERELALIRARGEPTTAEQLRPAPIPEGENAGILVRQAFFPLDTWQDFGALEIDACITGDLAKHLKSITTLVEANARSLALVREAVQRPHLRFGSLHDSPSDELVEKYQKHLGSLAQLCQCDALLQAESGHFEQAVQILCCLLDLARLTEELRFPWYMHLEGAIVEKALDVLRMMEAGAGLSDEGRAQLIAKLGALDFKAPITSELTAERVMLFEYQNRLLDGSVPGAVPWLDRAFRFRLRWSQAGFLRLMSEAIDASRLAPWDARPQMAAILDRYNDMPLLLQPMWAPVFLSEWTDWGPSYYYIQAWAYRDVAKVGLALRLYSSTHGGYPETLGPLVPAFLPELPRDAYTGRDLVYARKAHGFAVYSVGENLKDDGGVFNFETGDVVWEGPVSVEIPGRSDKQ